MANLYPILSSMHYVIPRTLDFLSCFNFKFSKSNKLRLAGT